jgi:hypothetical protein
MRNHRIIAKHDFREAEEGEFFASDKTLTLDIRLAESVFVKSQLDVCVYDEHLSFYAFENRNLLSGRKVRSMHFQQDLICPSPTRFYTVIIRVDCHPRWKCLLDFGESLLGTCHAKLEKLDKDDEAYAFADEISFFPWWPEFDKAHLYGELKEQFVHLFYWGLKHQTQEEASFIEPILVSGPTCISYRLTHRALVPFYCSGHKDVVESEWMEFMMCEISRGDWSQFEKKLKSLESYRVISVGFTSRRFYEKIELAEHQKRLRYFFDWVERMSRTHHITFIFNGEPEHIEELSVKYPPLRQFFPKERVFDCSLDHIYLTDSQDEYIYDMYEQERKLDEAFDEEQRKQSQS